MGDRELRQEHQEIAEQVNVGLRQMFKGIGEFTLTFTVKSANILLPTVIPAHVASRRSSVGQCRQGAFRGIDFSGKIQRFFADLWIILNGTLTYNKAVFMSWKRLRYARVAAEILHEISQQVGYIDQGLFHACSRCSPLPRRAGSTGPR